MISNQIPSLVQQGDQQAKTYLESGLSVDAYQWSGVAALWRNSGVELYLPWFATPQKTKLHCNIIVTFWKYGGAHEAGDNESIAEKD